jgi:excinuclease ABC subunit C
MLDSTTFLKNLSTRPGVYQMLAADDTVLYVGKAQNLKNRLSSYFRARLDSAKTYALMSQVHDIKVIITRSDTEALLLENNLIKKFKPRYNILLRDSKSYPYIYLSASDFPRIAYHRGPKKERGYYFGPYPNVTAARETMTFLQKLFLIRSCSDSFFRHRSRPCLQYQLKRCSAPCVDLIDKKNYEQSIRYTTLFLEGKSDSIIAEIAQKMDEAAGKLEFEVASKYRDQIVSLRKIQENQCVDLEGGEIDVIVIIQRALCVCVEVMTIRAGRLLSSQSYFFNTLLNTSDSEMLMDFLSQYYLRFKQKNHPPDMSLPEKILLNIKLGDRLWLEQALCEIFSKKVGIKTPVRGATMRWIKLAITNAEHALGQHLAANKYLDKQFADLCALVKIKNSAQLRVECFDISHTGGEEPVASCVVFNKNGPLKQAYRRFNIKDITPGDDYAAMRSALLRRFKNLHANASQFPDILIIDGGKGQLTQARHVLTELNLSSISLLGVAKGEGRKPGLEKLFIGESSQPLSLAPDSSALHLIQYIRDEAHRFAITGHRKRRAKRRSTSQLQEIPGIGEQRCGELLRYFGGLQGVKKATSEEIAAVAGMGSALAQLVYNFFHGESIF